MRILRLGSAGSDVMEVQSALKKAGYSVGGVDGIFGEQTKKAVTEFQRRFGLEADGVIGGSTWRPLHSFLLGYDVYTVRMGDTVYKIARKYKTDPAAIIAANPTESPENLMVGSRIKVPYDYDVVSTDVNYTYSIMMRNISGLKARYPFLQIGTAGYSVLGKTLFYIKMGAGPHHVFYNAAHHALEWITSTVLMKFTEEYLRARAFGKQLKGQDLSGLWSKTIIYIVPMVNPDGVDLVIDGLSSSNPYYSSLIRWNNGSTDFSHNWEANIRGVDINHNYDAAWEESKEAAEALGITGPGPTRYSGPYPVSEPETKAMVRLTRNSGCSLALAYHSQGEVIYRDFMDMAPPQAKTIGLRLSEISGYALEKASGISSYAGYKDWFTKEFRRPGYTVEVGRGVNPLPISQLAHIYNDNTGMLLYAAQASLK
ncbi:MAG TPA: peptidase M14 [Ruminococcaceae bacterium]|nr:peptidase M14 [Oscillospiraceae bacterium]